MISAVLNSRMGKTPYGKWLINTFNSVAEAKTNGDTICASVGLHQWEFLLYCASELNANVRIYVPRDYPDESKDELLHQFQLDRNNCRFIAVDGGRNGRAWWFARDKKILADADTYYPIAIRPGGNLEKMIIAMSSEKKIIDKFRVDYDVPTWHSPATPDIDCINPELKKLDWQYLTHWTHTSYSPWCNETKFDFYKSAIESTDDYSHSAFRGLSRILSTGEICTTRRNIRGNVDVVSFTEIPPNLAIFFMRWRKGLIRHYWEPYGIAVEREALYSIGARPVIYGDENIYDLLDENNRYLFQPIKGNKYFWSDEREWRLRNNFEISRIPPEKILIITRTDKEAQQINSRFGFKSIGIVKK